MKARFRMMRRGERGSAFYCVDRTTGQRTSLGTSDPEEAARLVHHRNEAERQPAVNLQIAKAYLAAADPKLSERTWGEAMNTLTETKLGSNRDRWLRAAKDPAFAPLLPKKAKELVSRAFESFATAVAQASGWSNVHTNFVVPFGRDEQGSWREVDVMGEQGDHHLALECKAYGRDKPLRVEDVTKFFKQTVPSYLKHYSQQKKVSELTAELWTTGVIPPECHQKLAEIRAAASTTHHYALRGPKDIVIPSKVESLRKLLESITDL